MGIFSKKQANIPRRRIDDPSNVVSRSQSLTDSFKRNITLSRYYHAGHDNSPRISHHHLSNKRRKLLGVLIITLIIIGLLSFLISQFTASVDIVVVNDNPTNSFDINKYQDSIQSYLNANPLSRLRFVLDNNRLNDFVTTEISEAGSVVQKTISGIGVTQFEIKLREPVASWKIGDSQYYVDSSGVAFETNYFEEPKVKVIDRSGAYLEAGAASVSRRFLSFVGQVVALSNQSGYSVSEAILPEDTTRQLNLILDESKLLVKMTIDRSVADQVGDMSRAIEHFQASGRVLQYIDVRVDDRVFFVD